MRATSIPKEREEEPGSTRCEKTGAPPRLLSTAVMWKFDTSGQRSDRSTSSWKCVANNAMGERVSRSSRYSQIACAIARPSTVPVPRPISSMSSRLRSVARRRMFAASAIST